MTGPTEYKARQAAATFLVDNLHLLLALETSQPVLDLACGSGRNGLLLAANGLPVVFADISVDALAKVEAALSANGLPGRTWQVDLERPGVNPFASMMFSAVIGFCYLHRPLFGHIKQATMPGGLVMYETFTNQQPLYGRPRNPAFLLQPGELQITFADWDILHAFEGLKRTPERSIAQIIARKPAA